MVVSQKSLDPSFPLIKKLLIRGDPEQAFGFYAVALEVEVYQGSRAILLLPRLFEGLE